MDVLLLKVLPLFASGGLNPLAWLGDAATEAVGQTWTAAMVAAWSSGLWVLRLAFAGVDAFTSPDLSAGGPMRAVYPYTFGLGLVVALVMAFAQIGAAAFKRDGQSIARVMVGVAQFGAVWLGYVAVASALVVAASGLTHGLLEALLGINGFSGYQPGSHWPRDVSDTTTATVLGICAWLLIWPAAIAYLLIMLVREAALLLLVATSPIAAGGLMSEMGRAWFWRSLRWFFAALMIAPLAALVLGVGAKISEGVVSGAGQDTTKAVGMAVVGCLLVLVGAICPLILFRLLAFVEPGTSSGAAMRTALATQGGVAGLMSGGGGAQSAGAGSAASQDDGAGRSAGEDSAESGTASRFAAAGASAAGVVGGAMAGVGRLAQGAVSVSSDVLSTSGVGHAHPYYPQHAPEQSPGASPSQSPGRGQESPSTGETGSDSGAREPPAPDAGNGLPDVPIIPPGAPGAPGAPGGAAGAGGGATGGGAGAGAAAGDGSAAAAAAAL